MSENDDTVSQAAGRTETRGLPLVRVWLSWVFLLIVYASVLILSRVARVVRATRSGGGASSTVIVTGTFYSRNWYLSHAVPLVRSNLGEIVFVVDEPPSPPLAGARCVCPSKWVRKLFGRAGSKLIVMGLTGLKMSPTMVMGYHIFPGAVSALLVARLLGRRACYQMTGGPVELVGGGWLAENPVMRGLGRPSVVLEKLAFAVACEFDLVVVRGRRALEQMKSRGARNVAILTGSVEMPRPDADAGADTESDAGANAENVPRSIDLVFVGRLSEIKQPGLFLDVVGSVRASFPDVRAVVIGSGPLQECLERRCRDAGLANNVTFLGHRDDVIECLGDARVFVLTSKSEGLSISMLEAMACGCVPVVPDIGELCDFVVDGVTGGLVPSGEVLASSEIVEAFTERILDLLRDDARWREMSLAARFEIERRASRDAVAERWRGLLEVDEQDVDRIEPI